MQQGKLTAEQKRLKKAWCRFAVQIVGAMKRHGILPPSISGYMCVDCGTVAEVWEHRDYGSPLDVVPVCHRCNSLRGSAVWPRFNPPETATGWEYWEWCFVPESRIKNEWIEQRFMRIE